MPVSFSKYSENPLCSSEIHFSHRKCNAYIWCYTSFK